MMAGQPIQLEPIESLAARSETLTAEELLAAMVERFHPRLSLACSFQKEESVLLDMLFGIEPKARVFAIDTHYLFPETYEIWREVERRYDTKVEVFEGPSADELTATHGETLWERKPELYLAIAKVEPLHRALGDLDCWITGIRRDQSPTRANASKLGWDAAHELWKANPLADWSDERCRTYIRERGLPYNALHDRGYASLGDTHSTLPGDGREGRWADSNRTECGLHAPRSGAGKAGTSASGGSVEPTPPALPKRRSDATSAITPASRSTGSRRRLIRRTSDTARVRAGRPRGRSPTPCSRRTARQDRSG